MVDEDRIDRECEALIRRALPKARAIAGPVGPLHALWDDILDGEAVLDRKKTLLSGSRSEVLRTIARHLAPLLETKP